MKLAHTHIYFSIVKMLQFIMNIIKKTVQPSLLGHYHHLLTLWRCLKRIFTIPKMIKISCSLLGILPNFPLIRKMKYVKLLLVLFLSFLSRYHLNYSFFNFCVLSCHRFQLFLTTELYESRLFSGKWVLGCWDSQRGSKGLRSEGSRHKINRKKLLSIGAWKSAS